MPKGDSEDLDILDDEVEDEDEVADEEEAEEEVEGDLDDAEDSDEEAPKAKDKTEKRIRDLQSQLDKAKAEADKLRKQVKGGGAEGSEAAKRDPEVQRWMEVAKDATRTRVFESDPRFGRYKIDPAVIAGDTPEEMRASAKALLRIIGRIETQVRNRTLQEHGFSTPPRESGAEPKRNFSTMSQEDFDRLVREAVGG